MPNINNLLQTLQTRYPNIRFEPGNTFMWSPVKQTIFYNKQSNSQQESEWILIHETAHADLQHTTYKTDIMLLKMEVAAWQRAKEIAQTLHITIPEDHIQDCLDTYRDWLHKRAVCPTCNTVSVQNSQKAYICFNCQTQWKVPESPVCRIKRTVVTS